MIQSIDYVDYGDDDENQGGDEVEDEDDLDDNEDEDQQEQDGGQGFGNYFDSNLAQSMPPHLQRPQTTGATALSRAVPKQS